MWAISMAKSSHPLTWYNIFDVTCVKVVGRLLDVSTIIGSLCGHSTVGSRCVIFKKVMVSLYLKCHFKDVKTP